MQVGELAGGGVQLVAVGNRLGLLLYLTPPTTAVWAWAMFGEAI